jgi:hypothetical protein
MTPKRGRRGEQKRSERKLDLRDALICALVNGPYKHDPFYAIGYAAQLANAAYPPKSRKTKGATDDE